MTDELPRLVPLLRWQQDILDREDTARQYEERIRNAALRRKNLWRYLHHEDEHPIDPAEVRY